MTDNEQKLIDIIDYLINEVVDEDGICENGCSCGECENCIEYNEKLEYLHNIEKIINLT